MGSIWANVGRLAISGRSYSGRSGLWSLVSGLWSFALCRWLGALSLGYGGVLWENAKLFAKLVGITNDRAKLFGT